MATRRTRACTLDTLDEELKAAIRAHGTKFGLEDIESDILMCCETITVHPKKGFGGGIRTSLSAVYVTPKWLVWADSSGRSDGAAGAVPLSQIDVFDDPSTDPYAIAPAQGLNVTGGYPDTNQREIAFIVLEAEAAGQRFRRVLDEAMRNIVK